MVAMAAVRAIVIYGDFVVGIGFAARGMANRDRGMTTAATLTTTFTAALTTTFTTAFRTTVLGCRDDVIGVVDVALIRAIIIYGDFIVGIGLAACGMADRDRGVTTTATLTTTFTAALTTTAPPRFRTTVCRRRNNIVGMVDVTGIGSIIIHCNFPVGIGLAACGMTDFDWGMTTTIATSATRQSIISRGASRQYQSKDRQDRGKIEEGLLPTTLAFFEFHNYLLLQSMNVFFALLVILYIREVTSLKEGGISNYLVANGIKKGCRVSKKF
jgi:hypothetical protein